MNQERSLSGHGSLIGSVLLGRYRIVRELAKGGMGVVYLARSEGAVGFVKPVVIKLILPEHAANERFLRMFIREAQILSQLRHPSVASVLEFGEQEGAYVMVLEYVRGHHLGQWSKYLKAKGRRIPTDILILLVIDILDALYQAHTMSHPDGSSMQIVHRDISPSNIMLDEDGRARLLDFGVARIRSDNVEEQTKFSGFVGKLPYIAPEVFLGKDASPKSDLYACAVVLHEALLGRNVFRGQNEADTMRRVVQHAPDWVASARDDIPDELDPILRRALAKTADERFADCREFAAALRKMLPEPESEMRVRLSTMLKDDFGKEMADLLGVESLADRDEAWRRLSLRPGPPRGDVAPDLREPSVSRVRRGHPQGHVEDADMDSVTQHTPPPFGMQRTFENTAPGARSQGPRPSGQRGMIIGLCVVGALAIAAIVVSLQGRPLQSEASRIVVVSQPLDPIPPVPAQQPVAEPVADQAVEQPDDEQTVEPLPKPQAAREKRTGPDPKSLARAFRREQSKIERCVASDTSGLAAKSQIQVEFDLNAQGKPTRVEVLPAAIAGTALGQCIHRVALGTAFPSQGEPVSFMIPVTASTSGTAP